MTRAHIIAWLIGKARIASHLARYYKKYHPSYVVEKELYIHNAVEKKRYMAAARFIKGRKPKGQYRDNPLIKALNSVFATVPESRLHDVNKDYLLVVEHLIKFHDGKERE